MAEIRPNTEARVDAVAVMYYPSSGLRHFAYTEYVFEDGSALISEANYRKGRVTFRIVRPTDYSLQGFWQQV